MKTQPWKKHVGRRLRMSTLCALLAATGNFSLHAEDATKADVNLQKLLDGNKRYAAGASSHPNQTPARRAELAKGQAPFAIVLTCSDSRVSPEMIFDQGLGDLFVVRVAGNTLDNASLGSIEYAAEHLKSPLVLVLGHSKCGAVTAAAGGGHAPGHIHTLVKAIAPAIQAAKGQPGDAIDNAARASVKATVQQLRQAEPIVGELVKAGKLKVVGARYDLETGCVELLP
jgi:carbonic anhydrase